MSERSGLSPSETAVMDFLDSIAASLEKNLVEPTKFEAENIRPNPIADAGPLQTIPQQPLPPPPPPPPPQITTAQPCPKRPSNSPTKPHPHFKRKLHKLAFSNLSLTEIVDRFHCCPKVARQIQAGDFGNASNKDLAKVLGIDISTVREFRKMATDELQAQRQNKQASTSISSGSRPPTPAQNVIVTDQSSQKDLLLLTTNSEKDGITDEPISQLIYRQKQEIDLLRYILAHIGVGTRQLAEIKARIASGQDVARAVMSVVGK